MKGKLYTIIVSLSSTVQALQKLGTDPKQGYTENEQKSLYAFNMQATERARIVLSNKNQFNCKDLATELNGKLDLF